MFLLKSDEISLNSHRLGPFSSVSVRQAFLILGVFVAAPRLKLQYEASAGSTPPEFCKGHVPAVSITFICPSRRHQVGEMHSDTW